MFDWLRSLLGLRPSGGYPAPDEDRRQLAAEAVQNLRPRPHPYMSPSRPAARPASRRRSSGGDDGSSIIFIGGTDSSSSDSGGSDGGGGGK